MRTFQQGMLEPEDTLYDRLEDIYTSCVDYNDGFDAYVESIKQAFIDDGWQPPKYTTESEPRTPGDDNVDQYKCQSYFDENRKLQNCTCGKCV